MRTADELRQRLLQACDKHAGDVLKKDYGSARPNPGRMIREGIAKARSAIESTPTGTDAKAYLAEVVRKLEALKDALRRDSTSDDGWDDEDGWVLGGVSTIQRAVEAEKP